MGDLPIGRPANPLETFSPPRRGDAERVKKIRARLEATARPGVLASMQRLVPGAKMLGVRVPNLRLIAVESAKDDPLTFESALALFDVLCAGDLREEILVGIFLLARHKRRLREIAWHTVDRWLKHIDNWETCDQLASNVMAAATAGNAALRPPLRELTRSGDVWRQRFAVATAASLNQHGRFFPELTLQICQDLMGDPNPAIRKAVGWAIRELSKKDASVAYEFLQEHRESIPRTLMREASEKLEPRFREALLGS